MVGSENASSVQDDKRQRLILLPPFCKQSSLADDRRADKGKGEVPTIAAVLLRGSKLTGLKGRLAMWAV